MSTGIEILLIVLAFITFWVLAALFMRARYSHRPGLAPRPPADIRRGTAVPAGEPFADDRGCCLESPCGPECARELKALRDRAGSQHDRVIAAVDQMMFGQDAPEESPA